MKYHLIALTSLMLPGVAFAQIEGAAEDRLEIFGEAPAACLIRTPAAATGNNATFAPLGGNTGEVRIVDFVDPSNAQPRAASIDLALPVICNTPHQLVLRSSNGGLRREGGGAGGQGPFAEFKSYNFGAAWAGSQVTAASDAGGQLVINSPAARAGDVSININVEEGGPPLIAGVYSDEIVVEFRAAH